MSTLEVEAQVRELVADRLGVDASALTREVSLTDDLAVDSLDLVELSLAVERALGVVLPRRVLEDVRTCGDLVDAVLTLARGRLGRMPRAAVPPPLLRARITTSGIPRDWTLERVLPLTPYALESIAEDTLGTGPGTRLEVTIADPDETTLGQVWRALGPLARRGVHVDIRRDPRPRRSGIPRPG